MKIRINRLFVFLILICCFSCVEIDNYDSPNAGFKGRLIDMTTGENFITENGGIQVALYENSWSETPSPQSIPSKQDGTFEDSNLFSGHYKVVPTNGPFWPVDTVELDVKGEISRDFELTPYLKITNLTHSLTGTTLTLKFNLEAPITEDLPNILDIKPFVNTTDYVGSGATISQYSDSNKKDINASWSDEMVSETYELRVSGLKEGQTFFARVGARVDDSYKKYNYSEIIEVEVPVQDPNAIPDNYLKNAEYPFVMAAWDGNRWGTLTDWVTNDAIKSRGDGLYGGYDGGYGDYEGGGCPSFGFERWSEAENSIRNGKIYQTFTLPAGTYQYTFSFGGVNPLKSNNGSDPRFIVAAAGETLPDVEDVENSLAYATLVDVLVDDAVTVEFTLDQETTVSVGLVIDWPNTEQNIRTSLLKLEKVE